MFHDLSWTMCALVSGWIVGPLYGINTCVFIMCLRVLFTKGLRGPNLVLFITAIIQFAISTGHVTALLVQLIRGFVTSAGTLDGPLLYFINQTTPEHLAQEVLYITNCVIGDGILIWRLYIVWGRNFRLCVPFIILNTASGIAGYVAIGNVARLNQFSGSVFLARIHDWLLATWSLSLATQFGVTTLIGYKIWRSGFRNAYGGNGSRLSVLWILVESGAIYSFTTVFLLGFSKNGVGALFVAALGQISAIAPTLIVARAGLKSAPYLMPIAKGSINNIYNPNISQPHTSTRENDMPDGSIALNITKTTHIHLDDETPPHMLTLDLAPSKSVARSDSRDSATCI